MNSVCGRQEVLGVHGRADGQAEQDRDDVDQRARGAVFFRRSVTPDSRSRLPNMSSRSAARRGHRQRHQHRDHDREQDDRRARDGRACGMSISRSASSSAAA
jgi:hypothetical protein